MSNACHNYFVLITNHLDKVLDENDENVFIKVGSMGFASKGKTGTEIHWEYGGVDYKTAEDFAGLFNTWDAHAWVEYIDKDGDVIVVDPWFEWYNTVCKVNNIKTKDKKNSRVFAELKNTKEQDRLFNAMVQFTLDSNKMTEYAKSQFDLVKKYRHLLKED